MPTIKEIAKACNVSVATVSNIINHKGSVGDATRERVEKVIREMNYTPNYVAKNLKTKNTRSIGCLLYTSLEVVPEFCTEHTYMEHVKPVRQKWFGVACCPPNVGRTLASLGQYIYAEDVEGVYINQFIS